MGGTTMTCPVCSITYRIHYDYMDERDFEDTPFCVKEGEIYCRKCNLAIVPTYKLGLYIEETYNEMLKYDIDRLNECIHKGYFSEAVLMLHIQILEEIKLLLINKFPISKMKEKEFKEFFNRANSYAIINFAYLYGCINKSGFDIIIKLNNLRNKFAHSFEERKKYDFPKMREIIDDSKEMEKKLRKILKKKTGARLKTKP